MSLCWDGSVCDCTWKGLSLSPQYLEKMALFDANLHTCCSSKVEENDWWLGFRARIMMDDARNVTQHWVRLWIYLSCIRTLTETSIYFLVITPLGNVFTRYALKKCICHFLKEQKTVVLLHLCFDTFVCVLIYLNMCIHKNTHIYTKEQTQFYEAKFNCMLFICFYLQSIMRKQKCCVHNLKKKVFFFIIKEI